MSSYQRKQSPGNTDWFVNDRFGMFIHFGLYSLAARHEWVMSKEAVPEEKYKRYTKYFDPDMFNADEWAQYAENAGMKYAVLTTRHHEGFALFDTKYSDYKITNTPFGRDLVKEYCDAFRAHGLKVGFYYSLLDWQHPDYTIDRFHPRRFDADAVEQNEKRDMHKYAEYMRNQLRELMTNYGKIDILWLDFSVKGDENSDNPVKRKGKGPEDWEAEKLLALVRELQPGIIINHRTGIEQDFSTPEQYQPDAWPRDEKTGELLTWETCQTFSGSWGYYRDEQTWKTPQMLIEMLIKTVSLGGNLIMNVGPCARGYIDKRATDMLDAYGKWMKYNSRSIYGCTMAEPEFVAPFGTLLTQSNDGKRLYIHLVSYPFKSLKFTGLAGKVEYAQFLHDASEILFTDDAHGATDHLTMSQGVGDLVFDIPVVRPDVTVPVIEVFLK